MRWYTHSGYIDGTQTRPRLSDIDALVGPRGKPADLPKVEQFISTLAWYSTTPAMARLAGRFRFDYARTGIIVSLPDMLIAATAIEHGLTLLTGNRRLFPMPELQVYPLPEGSL